MSKDQINQFDATAGNNTDIEGINTSETMMPSNVQDAIRSLMSLLKKQDVGTHAMTSPDINGGTVDGANITVGSGKTLDVSGGTLTLANDQISGDKINGGSISSTFVGNLTGDVTGNASGTAATVTTAAQPNITSLGALTGLDIDGAVQLDGTLSVGINDTGYDVKFYGAASGAYMLYDESADDLILKGGVPEFVIQDGLTDSFTDGNVSSSLVFKARNSSVRELARIDAIHGSTNGTVGALRIQTRHGDALAERLRILSDGKVGINMAVPAYPLDVYGVVGIKDGESLTWKGNAQHSASIVGSGSSAYLSFWTSANERFRVLSDGKVAIGQTTANEKLDVNGAIKVRGAVETNQQSSAVFGYQFNGARFISWGADDTTRGIYRFEAFEGDGGNAINVIETNTSGSVGFGVAPTIDSSLAGLSIGGKVLHLHDGSGASLKLSDAASGANRGLGIASVGAEASISNCEAGALRFGTGNTERARIAATGEFSVNTTSATGMINVTASSWSKNCLYLRAAATGGGQADFAGIGFYNGADAANIYVDEGHNMSLTTDANIDFKIGSTGISGGTSKMRVAQNGTVLVGTTTNIAANAKLYAQGSGVGLAVGYGTGAAEYRHAYMNSGDAALYFWGTANYANLSSAGAWTNASDRRIKKNIVDIKYGLEDVLKMQPRSFQMKEVEGDYIGLIAQEVEEIIPEVVGGDPEKQLTLDYGSLVSVAFAAIQEQQEIINSLTDRIAVLEGE